MQHGLLMEWDLESTPLEIKTDSVLGSNDIISLHFRSSDEKYSGLVIHFSSTPDLWISFCSTEKMNFATALPSAKDKVWRITLIKETGIRLQIHCNEVEVFDLIMSNSSCGDSKWSKNWGGDIVIVQFPGGDSGDTASDFYRPKPGYRLSIIIIMPR